MFSSTFDLHDIVRLSVTLLLPLFLLLLFLLRNRFPSPTHIKNLPPSPPKLPIIGNLHQLGSNPHRILRSLAAQYGPLMLLHLGNVPFLVVSSSNLAEQVLKTHDPVFSSRPHSSIVDSIYGCKDIAFAPYGEYWRQVKSICVTKLLSNRKVQSFRDVREGEVAVMVERIRVLCDRKSVINLGEMFANLTNDVICRVALGRKYGDGERGRKFKEVLERLGVFLGGFDLGEFVPWLGWMKYVNGMSREVRRVARDLDEFLESVVEEQLEGGGGENGENGKDFVDVLLEIQRDGEGGFELDRISVKALILVRNLDCCCIHSLEFDVFD